MSGERVLVEYGHNYLELIDKESDKYGEHHFDQVRTVMDVLSVAGINFETLVIVDDTSDRYEDEFGTERFEQMKREVGSRYVESLPVEPSDWFFESEFGPTLETVLSGIPCAPLSKLGKPDGWGLFCNRHKESVYLYGEHEVGTSKPKMKIADYSPTGNKSTSYTCGAYVTSMTLSKFGVFPGPERFPTGTRAVSIHSGNYYESAPYRANQVFQDVLESHDIIPRDLYDHPAHAQFGPGHETEDVEDRSRELIDGDMVEVAGFG